MSGPAGGHPGSILAGALTRRVPLRSAAMVPLAAGAGLIVTTSAIHLHLYNAGYRHVPTLGVLFMLQAISGFVLAAAILASRQAGLAAMGAGYMAASAAGLILSATVGFVGVHDSLSVPWATTSLVVELIGLVLLAGAAGAAAWGVGRQATGELRRPAEPVDPVEAAGRGAGR